MNIRSNWSLVPASLLITIGFLASALQAGPGDLDTNFGTGGVTAFSISGSNDNDYGRDLAIQSDGKIVSVGSAYLGQQFALARHNMDGTIDTSFANNGTVYGGFGAVQGDGNDVAIQGDGKIVAVGRIRFSFSVQDQFFLVARFTTGGALDTTFNGSGFATYDFGVWDSANAVLIQPSDQKIVVAGRADGSHDNFGILRYNTDGSLDSTFGSSGKVETDFAGGGDVPNSLAIQSDGKILAAGRVNDGGNRIGLARYDTDGSLDTSFSGDGKVITLVGEQCQAYSVHVLPSGKILVTGQTDTGEDDVIVLVRYLADGTLDTTFGDNGIALGPVGVSNVGQSAVQGSGRIVVAGSLYDDEDSDIVAVRFFPDGSLDGGFGMGGIAQADITGPSGNDSGYGIAVQADDRIVVCGDSYDGSDNDFSLARFESLSHQPDHIISGRGNNLYNLSGGGQTKGLVSKKARTVRSSLDIQNDGTVVETFDLQGTKGNRFFKVTYTSGGNVTAEVLSGTFSTDALDPGNLETVEVTVKPVRSRLLKRKKGKRVWLRKSRTLVLTGTSQTNAEDKDVAKIRVMHK